VFNEIENKFGIENLNEAKIIQKIYLSNKELKEGCIVTFFDDNAINFGSILEIYYLEIYQELFLKIKNFEIEPNNKSNWFKVLNTNYSIKTISVKNVLGENLFLKNQLNIMYIE